MVRQSSGVVALPFVFGANVNPQENRFCPSRNGKRSSRGDRARTVMIKRGRRPWRMRRVTLHMVDPTVGHHPAVELQHWLMARA